MMTRESSPRFGRADAEARPRPAGNTIRNAGPLPRSIAQTSRVRRTLWSVPATRPSSR